MRLFAIIILLLLLSTIALADGDPFYKAWVYPGDTFTANGDLFAVSSSSSEYEVLLERGLDKYLISYGSCKYSKDELEKYCFTESDYIDCQKHEYVCPDDNDACCPNDVAHVKYDAGNALFGAYIELSDVVPAMTIAHTSDKSLLKLGERATITVTLENTGEDTISAALYREWIPEGFELVLSPDFTEKKEYLEATVSIPQGAKKILKYTVRPLKYTSGSFKGNATYTYKGQDESATAPVFTINVPSPFIITHDLEPETSPIEKKVLYTYTLKNNDGENDMEATLSFGGFSNILSMNAVPSEVTEKNALFTWEGVLEKGEEKEIIFELKAGLTGIYPLVVNATMKLGTETFSYPVQDSLDIKATELKPELRLSSTRIIGGSEHVLRILLDNAEGDTNFFKIKGKLVSTPENIFGREVPMGKESVPIGGTPLIKEETFITPDVDSETKYTITLTGTYQTENNELYDFSKSLPITVIPATSTYLITHTVNMTTAKPGDEIHVQVKVKNNQEAYRTISVTESIPNGAMITGGTRQKEMSLERDEEREAYTYTIAVPESYQSESFLITTQVFDQQDDVTYTKGVDIKITLPFKEENVTSENETEVIVEPEPAIEPEEEKGFFRKILDGIIGFFENLFS